MRNFIILSLSLLAGVCLQSCVEEEKNPSSGDIQFVLNVNKTDDQSGRVKSVDFPPGSYLLVTVENSDGRVVLHRKEINLILVGDNYISDPIPLAHGNYKLTDFWVMSPAKVMLYAAPKELSPLAELVQRPLPFTFTVTEQSLLEEVVQVVDVTKSNPEDFGYVSFDIDVIRRFSLSVFIPQENGLTLTTAEAFILKDGDTLHIHSLDAKVNTIVFEGEPDDSFQLVVGKHGYSRFVRMFTFNQLKTELNGNPLLAVLSQALTYEADVSFELSPVHSVRLSSIDDLTIDWGDGASEIFTGDYSQVDHEYEKVGRYFISVTGALKAIKHVGFFYDDGRFTRIDLQHVTELTNFSAGVMGISPARIDFTNNKKLHSLTLNSLPNLEEIILPAGLKLTHVDIAAPNHLTTQDVDGVIDYVHQSATQYDLHDGYFYLTNTLTGEMTGPPSADRLTKLAELGANYGWAVYPGF